VDWFFEMDQMGMLGVVPSLFLSGANAVVFGMVPGFFISLIGEALGAEVSFYLYRFGIRKAKMDHKRWGWLQRLNGVSRKRQLSLLNVGTINTVYALRHHYFCSRIVEYEILGFFNGDCGWKNSFYCNGNVNWT
jgi:hypothetical protein